MNSKYRLNIRPFFKGLGYFFGGIVLISSIVDSLSKTVSIINWKVALIGSVLLVIFWIALESLAYRGKLGWDSSIGTIVVKRIGIKVRLVLCSFLFFLWVPLLIEKLNTKKEMELNSESNSKSLKPEIGLVQFTINDKESAFMKLRDDAPFFGFNCQDTTELRKLYPKMEFIYGVKDEWFLMNDGNLIEGDALHKYYDHLPSIHDVSAWNKTELYDEIDSVEYYKLFDGGIDFEEIKMTVAKSNDSLRKNSKSSKFQYSAAMSDDGIEVTEFIPDAYEFEKYIDYVFDNTDYLYSEAEQRMEIVNGIRTFSDEDYLKIDSVESSLRNFREYLGLSDSPIFDFTFQNSGAQSVLSSVEIDIIMAEIPQMYGDGVESLGSGTTGIVEKSGKYDVVLFFPCILEDHYLVKEENLFVPENLKSKILNDSNKIIKQLVPPLKIGDNEPLRFQLELIHPFNLPVGYYLRITFNFSNQEPIRTKIFKLTYYND